MPSSPPRRFNRCLRFLFLFMRSLSCLSSSLSRRYNYAILLAFKFVHCPVAIVLPGCSLPRSFRVHFCFASSSSSHHARCSLTILCPIHAQAASVANHDSPGFFTLMLPARQLLLQPLRFRAASAHRDSVVFLTTMLAKHSPPILLSYFNSRTIFAH